MPAGLTPAYAAAIDKTDPILGSPARPKERCGRCNRQVFSISQHTSGLSLTGEAHSTAAAAAAVAAAAVAAAVEKEDVEGAVAVAAAVEKEDVEGAVAAKESSPVVPPLSPFEWLG